MIACEGQDFLLETARLRLRPYRAADTEAYVALNADPAVMRWLGGPRSRAHSLEEMRQANTTLARHGFGKVAVARKTDDMIIGICGLSIEDWYSAEVHEIGWRLASAFHRQGFASEAALAWLAHGFGALGLRRVISIADAPNFASIRVMGRIGMVPFEERALNVHGDLFDAVVFEKRR